MLPFGCVDSLWIQGDVVRSDGEIHLTLCLPHGQFAPHETRFPAAYTEPLTVVDGPVPLPPYDAQLPEIERRVMP